jgi:hypothetical protein
MGRMSRQKGKRGEREAAAELGQLLGVDARRGVQYQGGPESPDVVLDADDRVLRVLAPEDVDVDVQEQLAA